MVFEVFEGATVGDEQFSRFPVFRLPKTITSVSNVKNWAAFCRLFGLASACTQRISVFQPTRLTICRAAWLYSLRTLVPWKTSTQFTATARIQITRESSSSTQRTIQEEMLCVALPDVIHTLATSTQPNPEVGPSKGGQAR